MPSARRSQEVYRSFAVEEAEYGRTHFHSGSRGGGAADIAAEFFGKNKIIFCDERRMCNLKKDYRNVNMVSIGDVNAIFFGTSVKFDRPVALKIFTQKAATYEFDVYEKIVPLLRARAPLLFVETLFMRRDCPYKQSMKNVGRLARSYRTSMESPDRVFAVIAMMRYPQTRTFERFVTDEFRSEWDLWEIYFQVCAGLLLLQNIRGMHNDLHTSNVLVRTHREPLTMVFKRKDVLYELRTVHQVLMYDWDQSYFEALGRNPLLEDGPKALGDAHGDGGDGCADLNFCNRFVRGKDLLQFTCNFVPFLGHNAFKEVFREGMGPFVEMVLGSTDPSKFTEYCTLIPAKETPTSYDSMDVDAVFAVLGNNPRIAHGAHGAPILQGSLIDLDA